MRNLRRLVFIVVLLCAGALATGFFLFVSKVKNAAPSLEVADGIVALTGGASRIEDAVKLLAEGYGKRLLITGLHPSTSRHDLAKLLGKRSYLIECCVDLDYEAVDTIGNADETQKWAASNRFTKLMIVTSNYHMPRTLLELHRAMPGTSFVESPVTRTNLNLNAWWSHPPTLRLLCQEYLKYVAVLLSHPAAWTS